MSNVLMFHTKKGGGGSLNYKLEREEQVHDSSWASCLKKLAGIMRPLMRSERRHPWGNVPKKPMIARKILKSDSPMIEPTEISTWDTVIVICSTRWPERKKKGKTTSKSSSAPQVGLREKKRQQHRNCHLLHKMAWERKKGQSNIVIVICSTRWPERTPGVDRGKSREQHVLTEFVVVVPPGVQREQSGEQDELESLQLSKSRHAETAIKKKTWQKYLEG